MSASITLQADLILPDRNGIRWSIPSGTVITDLDANQTQFAGGYIDGDGNFVGRNFATALCAVADHLASGAGRAALEANESEFDNQTVDGVDYRVTFGPDGQATFDSQGVSPSASPSSSGSASPSSSRSASPSSSGSASPSSSVSSSPSASPSSSGSASPSAS